jgi:hypothetical protein
MTCLDLQTKIAMMVDQLQIAHKMLTQDDLRPDIKLRVEEDIAVLKEDVRELYIELFKVISN